MKALVTGGAGFIGSHLAHLLLSQGHQVVAVDNLSTGRRENMASFDSHTNFRFAKLDIRDPSSLQPLIEGMDWVFHLAAATDTAAAHAAPARAFGVNVSGTFSVLDCARRCAVKRFLYAASASVYGVAASQPMAETAPAQPLHPLALTKHLGEQLVLHWVRAYSLPAVSLRLFNVYGARQGSAGVLGLFLDQQKRRQPLTVHGDGAQSRDFVHVNDVANAFLLAAQSNVSAQALNVGSGITRSIRSVAKRLGGEIARVERSGGEPEHVHADISAIGRLLGWKPEITFEERVRELANS